MAKKPSTTYHIEHIGGRRVNNLEISDELFAKAQNGNKKSQMKICEEFRNRYLIDREIDPGWVSYEYLVFSKA